MWGKKTLIAKNNKKGGGVIDNLHPSDMTGTRGRVPEGTARDTLQKISKNKRKKKNQNFRGHSDCGGKQNRALNQLPDVV